MKVSFTKVLEIVNISFSSIPYSGTIGFKFVLELKDSTDSCFIATYLCSDNEIALKLISLMNSGTRKIKADCVAILESKSGCDENYCTVRLLDYQTVEDI